MAAKVWWGLFFFLNEPYAPDSPNHFDVFVSEIGHNIQELSVLHLPKEDVRYGLGTTSVIYIHLWILGNRIRHPDHFEVSFFKIAYDIQELAVSQWYVGFLVIP